VLGAAEEIRDHEFIVVKGGLKRLRDGEIKEIKRLSDRF
jgi:hypothetical protein